MDEETGLLADADAAASCTSRDVAADSGFLDRSLPDPADPLLHSCSSSSMKNPPPESLARMA